MSRGHYSFLIETKYQVMYYDLEMKGKLF